MTDLPALDYRYVYRCIAGYSQHPTPKVHLARSNHRHFGTLCCSKRQLVLVPAGFTGPVCKGCLRVMKLEMMAPKE